MSGESNSKTWNVCVVRVRVYAIFLFHILDPPDKQVQYYIAPHLLFIPFFFFLIRASVTTTKTDMNIFRPVSPTSIPNRIVH